MGGTLPLLPQNEENVSYDYDSNLLRTKIYEKIFQIAKEQKDYIVRIDGFEFSNKIRFLKPLQDLQKKNWIGYKYSHKQSPLHIGNFIINKYHENVKFDEKWVLEVKGAENISPLVKITKECMDCVEKDILKNKKISLDVILTENLF